MSTQNERRERLRMVHERHPQHPDFEEVVAQDAMNGLHDCARYACVVQDAEPGDLFSIGLHYGLDDALDFMATDYPDRMPYALYDLDTGRSLPLHVSTRVTIGEDAAALVDLDLPPLDAERQRELAAALDAFKAAAARLEDAWVHEPDDAIEGSPMDFRELAAAVAGMNVVLDHGEPDELGDARAVMREAADILRASFEHSREIPATRVLACIGRLDELTETEVS